MSHFIYTQECTDPFLPTPLDPRLSDVGRMPGPMIETWGLSFLRIAWNMPLITSASALEQEGSGSIQLHRMALTVWYASGVVPDKLMRVGGPGA